ncbi:aldehyde dehydrogenase family protein [uncultured Roseibium sp.]|uniref:aldehyde dehydrogenase family protein n=1 Tax=uncultured Roseibium sp. TaxID=1936171 RepID=UPI003748596F
MRTPRSTTSSSPTSLGGLQIAYAQADDEQNEIGPLISMRQRDRVAGFVERALEQPHMEAVTGGKVHNGNGFFYPADRDCRCASVR